MGIQEILNEAVKVNASDIFMIAAQPITFKINKKMMHYQGILDASYITQLIEEIYKISGRNIQRLKEEGDDDFSFAIATLGRFRVNTYKQRGSFAAVIRIVRFELPQSEHLAIPSYIMDLWKEKKGLILVTGPAGSGKSTTLACLVDAINNNREGHIITLEEPIEYIHRHNKSIVSQREIGLDTATYLTGLKSALREAPDVILLGEMRDLETISVAITAAETGQLVLSTLHTLGAANTINRIIDVFPSDQQRQIRVQLAMVLKAIVSQQLITTEQGVVPAFELMRVTPAISNLIRDNKIHQIDAMMVSTDGKEMQTMDNSLLDLYKCHKLSKEQAIDYSFKPEILKSKL